MELSIAKEEVRKEEGTGGGEEVTTQENERSNAKNVLMQTEDARELLPDGTKVYMVYIYSSIQEHQTWYENLTHINLVGAKLFDACCIQQVTCYYNPRRIQKV